MSEPPITAGYVDVEGTRTFHEECGPDSGQDVICVHTAGQDALEWRWALPELGDAGYHAHALDLPGHGKSLPPEGGYIDSIHGFAEFVRSFADAKGITDPVAVGCSIGGDIVLDLAVHHSEELTAIVSCESALRTSYPEGALEMLDHESGNPSEGYYGTRHVHGSEAIPERVEEHSWLARRSVTEVKHADLTAWNDHDITDRVGEIDCPVLYVWGVQDYTVPEEDVEAAREALPDPEFERMEGIGHYPMVETDAFSDRVVAFLDGL